MSDHMKLAVLLFALVVIGLPILGNIASKEAPSEPGAAGKAAATGKTGKQQGPAPAGKLEPPRLNATNLVNTQWQMTIQGITATVTFNAGGVAVAQTPIGVIQGSWTVNGADLTVSGAAMGKSFTNTVKISGDQIIVDNVPVKRLK